MQAGSWRCMLCLVFVPFMDAFAAYTPAGYPAVSE